MTDSPNDLRIGFIGAGRVASGLGLALAGHGYAVVAASSRSRRSADALAARVPGMTAVSAPQEVADASTLVFITTPDDLIGPAAEGVTWRAGQAVAHCSGAAEVDVLSSARAAGARIGGFHPLQNFAVPETAARELPGCTVAIEADEPLAATLESIARSLGAVPLRLPPGVRALYHASASYAGPFVVRLLLEASSLWSAFGVEPDAALGALLPLARGTLASVAASGSHAYIGGAVARGDVGTVRRHLEAMNRFAPDRRASYARLLLEIVPVAVRQGTLSEVRAGELTALLAEAL